MPNHDNDARPFDRQHSRGATLSITPVPNVNEARWLRDTAQFLRSAGYEGPFSSIHEAVEAAGRAIREHSNGRLVRLLCRQLGEELPTSAGINVLLELLRNPSPREILAGQCHKIVVEDYRALCAAQALADASRPPERWGDCSDTRIRKEDADAIRQELRDIGSASGTAPAVRQAVREVLARDGEQTMLIEIGKAFGAEAARLFGKWLDEKRYRSGRGRRWEKEYLSAESVEYRQAWVSISGDGRYDNFDEVLIDVQRASGLTEINRQKRKRGTTRSLTTNQGSLGFIYTGGYGSNIDRKRKT